MAAHADRPDDWQWLHYAGALDPATAALIVTAHESGASDWAAGRTVMQPAVFGTWVWCLPALALLAFLARHDHGRAPLHLGHRST